MRVGENSHIRFCDNMDQENGIPFLEDDTIDLIFTSPPYWNYIDYEGDTGVGKEDVYPEYMDSLMRVFGCAYFKLKPGGRLVVNVSNMHSRLQVEGRAFLYPIAYDIVMRLTQFGWILKDEIIWHKGGGNQGSLGGKMLFGSYPYPPTPKFLSAIFENIFVFERPGDREKVPMHKKETSRLSKKEWIEWTNGIWKFPPEKDDNHPATFPFEMARRVIKLFTFEGETVLDPFSGSGTTIVAAEKYGRRGIGFEISPAYRGAVEAKVAKYIDQLTLEGVD